MPKKKKDLGHTEADRELKKYERELKKQYEKAYLSMRKEADKYFSKFEAQQERMLMKLDKGEIDFSFKCYDKKKVVEEKIALPDDVVQE